MLWRSVELKEEYCTKTDNMPSEYESELYPLFYRIDRL